MNIKKDEWADFRQEFGQLLGKVDSIHDQVQKTNGRVTVAEGKISTLETSVAVNKTKIAGISGGIATAITFLLSVIKDKVL